VGVCPDVWWCCSGCDQALTEGASAAEAVCMLQGELLDPDWLEPASPSPQFNLLSDDRVLSMT